MSFKNLGSLAHTTAKAGIIGMTRQLAMEGREHGIRANSISPGQLLNQAQRALVAPIRRANPSSFLPDRTAVQHLVARP
jgi:NAD(P)-dependent dehydrogenase (short-subunit alcohol dehydrogenase family)